LLQQLLHLHSFCVGSRRSIDHDNSAGVFETASRKGKSTKNSNGITCRRRRSSFLREPRSPLSPHSILPFFLKQFPASATTIESPAQTSLVESEISFTTKVFTHNDLAIAVTRDNEQMIMNVVRLRACSTIIQVRSETVLKWPASNEDHNRRRLGGNECSVSTRPSRYLKFCLRSEN